MTTRIKTELQEPRVLKKFGTFKRKAKTEILSDEEQRSINRECLEHEKGHFTRCVKADIDQTPGRYGIGWLLK